MTPTPPLTFDTNILVHAIRGDDMWHRITAQFAPLMAEPRPQICVVSVGEIQSLAQQWNWGEFRMEQMRFLLDYFVHTDINDSDVYAAYATMDAWSKKAGFKMGKNDLWIAATAYVSNTSLLTNDADFAHLSPDFLNVIYP